MYVPIAQLPDGVNLVNLRLLPLAWFVRVGEPSPPLGAMETELRAASGGLPVAQVRSLEQVKARSIAPEQFQMLLVTFFGACALLLAAVGVYGVMAYGVEQRTRELGVRLALGANPGALRNMVMSQALGLTALGVAAGAAGGLGLAKLSLISTYVAWDPVMISAPIILSAIALLAAAIPARRATRVDPVTALRWE